MFIERKYRRVMAGEDVDVAPEASEMLFQADDVADVIAEVTGKPVKAEVSDDKTGAVEFTVGDPEDGDVYVVEPEGDEEVVESAHRISRNRKSVQASSRVSNARRRNARRR